MNIRAVCLRSWIIATSLETWTSFAACMVMSWASTYPSRFPSTARGGSSCRSGSTASSLSMTRHALDQRICPSSRRASALRSLSFWTMAFYTLICTTETCCERSLGILRTSILDWFPRCRHLCASRWCVR
ncbi:unnamed protein product [Chondrus crispus]|uniref:Uncharacterized protein n=1 Tax=Chondrus crispus TaxID=2769 RepID=R7QT30_CHOCR|nr:unnamed protein product [Chondrus crispus]CDF41294.1 unnamed protein product [Chondrus crispus]|eukprot:XP_005711588.1 unnamed protein product [Chondrus crispus]